MSDEIDKLLYRVVTTITDSEASPGRERLYDLLPTKEEIDKPWWQAFGLGAISCAAAIGAIGLIVLIAIFASREDR